MGLRLRALEAVVRRVAAHPLSGGLVLRGGMVTRQWLLPLERPVDDVDFLADPAVDHALVRQIFEDILTLPMDDGAELSLAEPPKRIWEETAHPGLRALLWVELEGSRERVQLDVGFGDPLDPPAEQRTLPTEAPPRPVLRQVRVETGLAWKLHGLFEHASKQWRQKDLHDLDLLLAQPHDEALLRRAIPLAFSSRDTPLSACDRLFEGELGRSRGSRTQWEALREARPGLPWSPLEETVARVGERLRPLVEACLPSLPESPDRFPRIERLEEVWSVVGGLPGFVAHRRGELTVINAEHNDEWPGGGRWPRTQHHRAIRRECRGLIFGADGGLIARPYHKFFQLGEHPETLPDELAPRLRAERPRALEKLDGAMVTAGRLDGALRLFTRRGPSPLASAAEAHLRGRPRAWRQIEALVDEGWTPIFEWCAREHRLVIDYPEPRLVLTALRRRITGDYLDYDELSAAAPDLERPACWGRVEDLDALARDVRAAPEGEGVVLRFDSGELVKLKSWRYLRLHRAVESVDPTKARWEVVLAGETDRLLPLLDPEQGAELRRLDERVRAAIGREIAWIEAQIADFGPLEARPKAERGRALHALVEGVGGPRAVCLRAVAAGEPADAVVRRVAADLARGRGARSLREWLT